MDLPQKESRADVAYSHLKRQILSAALPPDSVVDEKLIAQDLGVSRTPMRQATGRLATEGYVRVLPQRGTLVAPLSVADMEQVYLLRSLIEPVAASLAAQRATPGDIAHLETCEQEYLEAFEVVDQAPDHALHTRFHVAVAEIAAMPRLTRIVRELQEQTQWFLAVRLSQGRQVPSPHSHHPLIEAIRSANAQQARDLSRSTILASRSKILAGTVPDADLLLATSAALPFGDFTTL
ncbi:MAG: GntR family transcriptional regulator [Brachybacterium sp.]|nr:GntR family transcriptional regulator [Brachybacterium sp.]